MGQFTVTKVPCSTASVTLATSAAEIDDYVLIQNDAASRLYVKYGPGASLVDFSYYLDPGQMFEMRVPLTSRGVITGIWASADPVGNARVSYAGA